MGALLSLVTAFFSFAPCRIEVSNWFLGSPPEEPLLPPPPPNTGNDGGGGGPGPGGGGGGGTGMVYKVIN